MKKLAKIAALLLAVMLLLGACTPNTPASTDDGTTATTAPAEATPVPATDDEDATDTPADSDVSDEPAQATVMGEDYHYIFNQDITTLNYLVTNKSVDADIISRSMDPLVLVNNRGQIEPGLATSWEQSADGLTWTFHLREGIQWQRHDGTPYAEITAQDFVDGVEYLLNPTIGSFVADFVLDFIAGASDYYDEMVAGGTPDIATVGVKAVDKYTVEYTTTEIIPYFLSLTTYSCYLPINKAFVEEIGGIDNFGTTNQNFLYYGEFLFTTWERGQLWVLEKNPDYYYADRVHMQVADFVFVEDATVSFEMYKRGEISASPIRANKYDIAMADPEMAPFVFRTSLTSASWQYYFQVNTNPDAKSENLLPALNNTNFRKAFFAAIDRTAVLSVSSVIDPGFLRRNTLNIWGLSTDENGKDYMTYGNLGKYEAEGFDFYNAEQAQAYLAAAKEELGDSVQWPVTVRYLLAVSESATLEANIIKQSVEETLGADNVVVEFYEVPSDEYYDRQEAGAFDFTYGGWSPDYADPSAYLEIYQANGYIGSRNGMATLDDHAEFERLMVEAKSKTVLSERYAALAAAEEYMIENALVLPYRASGGNYSINNIQNPYSGFSRVPYGLCTSMYKDMVYGTQPLTIEEREVLKAEFEAGN